MSTIRSLGAVAAEVSGMETLPPLGNYRLDDPMTPSQQERALKALAKGRALQQAYAMGLSRAEVESKVWTVEVHPL